MFDKHYFVTIIIIIIVIIRSTSRVSCAIANSQGAIRKVSPGSVGPSSPVYNRQCWSSCSDSQAC